MSFPPDESYLITLLQTQPLKAIELIYKTYHPALFRIAYRILSDEQQAKDAVQEVFIKFWQNHNYIQIKTSLKAYLYQAVIHASLNYFKKSRKVSLLPLNDKTPIYTSDHLSEESLLSEELQGAIHKAINRLPPRCKIVFTLNRWEGLTYKEIAAALGISPKAVEKEMMKALKLLRVYLKEFLPLFFSILLPEFIF